MAMTRFTPPSHVINKGYEHVTTDPVRSLAASLGTVTDRFGELLPILARRLTREMGAPGPHVFNLVGYRLVLGV